MDKNIPEDKRVDNFVKRRIIRGFEKTFLVNQARSELDKIRYEQNRKTPPTSIYDLFDKIEFAMDNNGFHKRPYHLDVYVQALENCLKPGIQERLVLHSPSQMGKSSTTLVGLLFHCLTGKDFKGLYVTYSEKQTLKVRARFLLLLKVLGVEYYKDSGGICFNIEGSKTPNTLHFTSIGGNITGGQFNLIAVDDYIKGDLDSRKASSEEKIYDWFNAVIVSRRAQSIIIIATRASNTDLSGLLINKQNYKYVRLAAICDDEETDPNHRKLGEALNPDMCNLETIQVLRRNVGERMFQLQYQGNMVSDSTRTFQPVTTYKSLPNNDNIITVYGLDLAYSPNKKADWSVAVRLCVDRTTGIGYVDDVLTEQQIHRDFFKPLVNFVKQKPGPLYWYTNGIEALNAGVELKQLLPRATTIVTGKSKYSRAGDTSSAWNQGYIKCPEYQSDKLIKFISTVELFTGADGERDDGVDALVAAWDAVKHIKQNIDKIKVPGKSKSQIQLERNQKNKIGSPMNIGGRRNQSI